LKRLSRVFPYFLLLGSLGLTIAGGLYHGNLTQRWGTRPELSSLAQQLTSLPESIGPWQLRESYPLAEPTRDILRCSGYLNRHYVHDETGDSVSVAVMLGPAGPISVHTPEVCYSSRDFKQRDTRQSVTVRAPQQDSSEFWRVTFDSTGLEKTILRTYYAWTFDGTWSAAENPRMFYAGQPYLLKIQLAAMLPTNADLTKDDPCERFLADFVPALRHHVFSRPAANDMAATE
jgi:hypothetical protein